MVGVQTFHKTTTGWVINLPSEFARELGVAEGSAACLQARNGQIEAEILPPVAPAPEGRPDSQGDFFPDIQSNSNVMGGAPCIRRTRIPIWLLEQARQLGLTDAALLEAYPILTAQDLTNAWDYVHTHRVEIEQQIADNERDDD